MDISKAAIQRVVNIWDCPVCDAGPGEACHQLTGPLSVHAARFPYHYDPAQMVRTAKTVKLKSKMLREDEERRIGQAA